MSYYMLHDIEDMENVRIIHSKSVTDSNFLNLLYNIHNSGKIQQYINLPFRGVWDKLLFDRIIEEFTPEYIIFTISWYSDHLIAYFRKRLKKAKLILRFSDMVVNSLGGANASKVDKIRRQFDGVRVYSMEDAKNYGLTYRRDRKSGV